MTIPRRFTSALALTLFALFASIQAQTPAPEAVNGTAAPSQEQKSSDDPPPAAVGQITGQGAVGKIAKFNGANSITNSTIMEASGKIGIGTTTPGSKLTVVGGGAAVINGLNNVTSTTPGSGVSGTGAPGANGFVGSTGGAGVVGTGGKGGNSDFNAPVSGAGGDGIVGTGGEGGTGGVGTGFGGVGVRGIGGSPSGTGVSGQSDQGNGVSGQSMSGNGVVGLTSSGIGVFGSATSGGFSGLFNGKVQLNGNTSITSPSALSFGSTSRQMINLYSTIYGIGVQTSTEYFRTNGGFAWYRGGTHSSTQNSAGGGTTLMRLDISGNLYTAGVINPPSDRALKANFVSVNPRAILQRVASLPISTWNYKQDGDSVRHLGPVAQDFKAAFNLGTDDKHIATVDADGVALASIQALYQLMLEKDRQNQELNRRVERLQAQLAQQQAQLDQVRRVVRRGGRRNNSPASRPRR